MKRWIAMAVVAFMLNPMVRAQPVYFADPDLKEAVEAALGFGYPTAVHMQMLTSLGAVNRSISDLTGLQFASNLTYLDLGYNQISDVTPVAPLKKLTSLYLGHNQIRDVTPLAELPLLGFLDLCQNRISDLPLLNRWTNLEELNLANNSISNLSPLAGLRNVRILRLHDNQISDISPLVTLADYDLEWVELQRNPLDWEAYDSHIPTLLAAGIIVDYDPLFPAGAFVPDVVGMSQADAKQAVEDAGFTALIVTASSDTVPAGDVISQAPAGGTQAALGSTVTLRVSTGPGGGPGPGPGSPTPVAHWTLDETSGTTAVDSTGSHNGRLYGNPTWQPDGGMIDGALRFDGANDYVDCGTFNPSAATGQLTVCLWARWEGMTDWYQGLIGKRDTWNAGEMMWQLEASRDSGIVGFFREGSGPRDGFVLPVGEWMHVAATCDGTTAKLYSDGQQVTSGPMTFGSDTTAGLVFGACQGNGENPFKGALDDVRLYDEALNADQVRAVMGGTGRIDWIRALYWDDRYPSAWVRGTSVRDALESAGYSVLDADALSRWMNIRIQNGEPSVVVFCQDIAPDTVYEAASWTCTLRKYLDAGGKIVWCGDIPLYYQGHSDGTRTAFGVDGSIGALGFNAAGGTWDSGEQVMLTDEGRAWGLTQTWPSARPAPNGGLRVLARDSRGQAAAWVKHYLPGDTYCGLVRFSDCGAVPSAMDVRRLAEYPNTPGTAAPSEGQAGPLAYYAFDEGEGTIAHDSSGFGHDATLIGGPRWAAIPGNVSGTALQFDGIDDSVQIPPIGSSVEFSYAMWLRPAELRAGYTSLMTTTHWEAGAVHWGLFDGRPKVGINAVVTPGDDLIAQQPLAVDTWVHVVLVKSSSFLAHYVDGEEVARRELTQSGQVILGQANISDWQGERRYKGLIDDVLIFNRALTAAEIVAID